MTTKSTWFLNIALDCVASFQTLGHYLILKLQSHVDLIAHYNVGIYDRLLLQPVLLPNKQPD